MMTPDEIVGGIIVGVVLLVCLVVLIWFIIDKIRDRSKYY